MAPPSGVVMRPASGRQNFIDVGLFGIEQAYRQIIER